MPTPDSLNCSYHDCPFGGKIHIRMSTGYCVEWIDVPGGGQQPAWFHGICLREYKREKLIETIAKKEKK